MKTREKIRRWLRLLAQVEDLERSDAKQHHSIEWLKQEVETLGRAYQDLKVRYVSVSACCDEVYSYAKALEARLPKPRGKKL